MERTPVASDAVTDAAWGQTGLGHLVVHANEKRESC